MNKSLIGLTCLCCFDTGATFIGIKTGICEELNPLLNFFVIHYGLIGFVLAKIVLFTIIPLVIIEVAGKRGGLKRQKIDNYYMLTIVVYILILGNSTLIQFIQ